MGLSARKPWAREFPGRICVRQESDERSGAAAHEFQVERRRRVSGAGAAGWKHYCHRVHVSANERGHFFRRGTTTTYRFIAGQLGAANSRAGQCWRVASGLESVGLRAG